SQSQPEPFRPAGRSELFVLAHVFVMLSEAKQLLSFLSYRVRKCPEILRSAQNDSTKSVLKMNATTENILVIRRSLFDELGSFQGLNFEPNKYLKAILSRGSNFYIPRPEAETNPGYKQIIPYALIAFEKTVLHYVRGKKAGE